LGSDGAYETGTARMSTLSGVLIAVQSTDGAGGDPAGGRRARTGGRVAAGYWLALAVGAKFKAGLRGAAACADRNVTVAASAAATFVLSSYVQTCRRGRGKASGSSRTLPQ